ncbi:hypothetical protein SAMN06295945_0984 [Polynucleobacter meluiroseus]|uniref:Uncharacterized protein n=1 Tax=Polynucleobacter meluiroseus TaxID=1938814 RepID=A0A240DZN0_9BURK|nr:hypothetical protein [Polynucleobacter meluiroseus]SNX28645.1 hypothetical protein SAMN06295945_0984 [Polynucleobacter meluiroseus]
MKKLILLIVSISVAAIAYANTSGDSRELISQQCQISAEAVVTMKSLQYGNTSIRKDVSSLIQQSLKSPENREAAQVILTRMIDDRLTSAQSLSNKYCS